MKKPASAGFFTSRHSLQGGAGKNAGEKKPAEAGFSFPTD